MAAGRRRCDFAASATSERVPLTGELEAIIRDVARTGATTAYPWGSLRLLLARKLELVLADFWREVPDLQLSDGESFERAAVEPLTQSLLEPRREAPPFTTQRLCELLAEPRVTYKSTRRYLYALQRSVVITLPESEVAKATTVAVSATALAPPAIAAAAAPSPAAPAAPAPSTPTGPTSPPPSPAAAPAAAPERQVAEADVGVELQAEEVPVGEACSGNSSPNGASSPEGTTTPTGRKRKLSPELSNGIVAE